MKGNSKVLEALNKALTVELTAINQYFVQAKMCRNWGLHKLAAKIFQESIGEMRHAEKLIDRILFLEGEPVVSRYGEIRVGRDVKAQLENDLRLERGGVATYNEAIHLCSELKDAGSREILEHIVADSEEHVDWLESQLHLIASVGLPNYLAEQIGSAEPAK